jgi:two-component system chemotaxis response regulator CheY
MDTSRPVLVVDDYESMALVIERLVRQLAFVEVDHARDGEAALLMLAQKRYGLVISDWEMRPMGGHELIRKIRADPLLCDMPVILATARDSADLSLGFDGHLRKPFSLTDLRKVIETVLNRRPGQTGVR